MDNSAQDVPRPNACALAGQGAGSGRRLGVFTPRPRYGLASLYLHENPHGGLKNLLQEVRINRASEMLDPLSRSVGETIANRVAGAMLASTATASAGCGSRRSTSTRHRTRAALAGRTFSLAAPP